MIATQMLDFGNGHFLGISQKCWQLATRRIERKPLSVNASHLLTGADPGTAADWQLREFERGVPLFPIDGPHIWHDMEHAGDFFPRSEIFWRGWEAVTAGY